MLLIKNIRITIIFYVKSVYRYFPLFCKVYYNIKYKIEHKISIDAFNIKYHLFYKLNVLLLYILG